MPLYDTGAPTLPDPEQLRAVLTVARECGLVTLELEGLKATFAPRVDPERPAAHQPDPLDVIRQSSTDGARQSARDILDVLASGGRFVDVPSGDPTAA